MVSIGEHILLRGRWVRGRQISAGDSRFAPYFFLCRRGFAAGERIAARQRLLSRLGYGMGVRQDNWSEGLFGCRWPKGFKMQPRNNRKTKSLDVQKADPFEAQGKPELHGRATVRRSVCDLHANGDGRS